MNSKRRLEVQRLVSEIERVTRKLIDMHEEEEHAFEQLPRSQREGEKGKTLRSGIDSLFTFTSSIHNAVEEVQCSPLGVRIR